ncbi:hypothetical protein [Lelliottia amnigena]
MSIISSIFTTAVKLMILISLIAGVYLFCKNVFGEVYNLWAGLGAIITSFSVAYFLLRLCLWGDFCLDTGSSLALIGTGLGLIGILSGAKFVEPKIIELRVDLQEAFRDASLNCVGDKNLYEKALMSCATAYPREFLSLSNQLAKAIYLTPMLSLADGVFHSTDEIKPDSCTSYYFSVSKQCPDSFVIFHIKHPGFVSESKN